METQANSFPETIKTMFGIICPHYDRINRILSLGRDFFWRHALSRRFKVIDQPGEFLDLATGTGCQLVSARKYWPKAHLVGLDFSAPMLEAATARLKNSSQIQTEPSPEPVMVLGDALSAPLGQDRFDSISISFGLRNILERSHLYHKAYEALKPGGRFLILEFWHDPRTWWARFHRTYLLKVVPFLATCILGAQQTAYRYLARSVILFPDPGRLTDELVQAGFTDPGFRTFTFGAVMLVWAHKPNH
ncbi:MAG: ubiquinone/menaquinone biosynthesis methyltransferase [Deltaproteobacteria bacterium]|jgi:demethylmenaquinone methyltransferase/2-methoxy-6-polyprenyl-1,4-benzoquinol methylase|nr:ubiquinone/menaquinone biosynthesis methyltransferase [Deltaproteobacteria bacterium]